MAGIKRRIYICTALILFFAGLVLISYPHIKGEQLETEAAESIVQFVEAKKTEREQTSFSLLYPDLYQDMQLYNQRIFEEKQSELKDNFSYAEPSFTLSDYGLEAETIAVLNIPVLELSMPVYLGANEENMAAGAAHMSNTSLPIGGTNTNCVIAGHRGYSGADYFKHLDILKEGDSVQLVTLWNTLNYTVSEIKIIEPYEVEQILIQEERELLTLLTCHPYASGGRYRYLVICERS
ncbi:MAG: class C sortase [Oscillospiraceae bacterium]|nr:class C sortase [Oscillospiraceae bacterium]